MTTDPTDCSFGAPLRLYRDLTDGYPLLTPVADYAEESAFYRHLFEAHCRWPPGRWLPLTGMIALR